MAPGMLGRPVTISGLGTYLPASEIANAELPASLDTSDEWITQRTGIRSRRVAPVGVSASDLGVPAARAALSGAGLEPEKIDLVICATISPDNLMPATAARIAHEVGALNAGSCDLSAGCTGFVYALAMASGLVASGLREHVLVVGAEVISRILDWSDRGTAVLFGDGSGAVVVSPADGAGRILGFDLGSDGSGADLLSIPAGGSRMPATHETVTARQHYLHMNGREVYRFATRVISESAHRVLDRCGRAVDEIDLFVPHQANLRIIEAASARLGVAPDRVCTNLQRYGNTSCASIPLCLTEAEESGRLKTGDLVLLMGFGAGLTWGACLMEWSGSRR
ncbi:MAG: ketoacyl-ACP synthase III [Thermoleophilia bacterium]|nr:ketoacyl-ACP synthase III [Thermoleophilia bacterium]